MTSVGIIKLANVATALLILMEMEYISTFVWYLMKITRNVLLNTANTLQIITIKLENKVSYVDIKIISYFSTNFASNIAATPLDAENTIVIVSFLQGILLVLSA